MSTPAIQGQREGTDLKRLMTEAVERARRPWTRAIQRAFLQRLMAVETATCDDIRDAVTVPEGLANSVYGAGLQGLVKGRLIRAVGRVVSSRPSRHGCEIRAWTLNVDHGRAQAWLDSHPPIPLPDENEGGAGGPIPSTPTPPPSLAQAVMF